MDIAKLIQRAGMIRSDARGIWTIVHEQEDPWPD